VSLDKLDRNDPPRDDRPQGKPPEGGPEFKWQKSLKPLLFWAVIFMAGLLFYQILTGSDNDVIAITYTEFVNQIKIDNVSKATFVEKDVKGEFNSPFEKMVDDRKVEGKKIQNASAVRGSRTGKSVGRTSRSGRGRNIPALGRASDYRVAVVDSGILDDVHAASDAGQRA
jgi:hypothetical protein